ELTERDFVRIGLSATQRPLEEVARYLGGAEAGQVAPSPCPLPLEKGQGKRLSHLPKAAQGTDTFSAARPATRQPVDGANPMTPAEKVSVPLPLEGTDTVPRTRDRVSQAVRSQTESGNEEPGTLVPRAVTVIDAGLRKDLDLLIECPVKQFGALPEK